MESGLITPQLSRALDQQRGSRHRPLRSAAQVHPQSQLPPPAQEQVLEHPQPQGQVVGWVRGVEEVQAMVILRVGDGLGDCERGLSPAHNPTMHPPVEWRVKGEKGGEPPSGPGECSPGGTPGLSTTHQGIWRPSGSGCGMRVGRSRRSASHTLMID